VQRPVRIRVYELDAMGNWVRQATFGGFGDGSEQDGVREREVSYR
jgi:hypothetical protein